MHTVQLPQTLPQQCRDWLGKYVGNSRVALKPKSTEQVAALLSHCNRRALAVVPQGGNTGLVGGSIPVFDEVVISLAAMNQVWEGREGLSQPVFMCMGVHMLPCHIVSVIFSVISVGIHHLITVAYPPHTNGHEGPVL
jgi:hypothetical protein